LVALVGAGLTIFLFYLVSGPADARGSVVELQRYENRASRLLDLAMALLFTASFLCGLVRQSEWLRSTLLSLGIVCIGISRAVILTNYRRMRGSWRRCGRVRDTSAGHEST